MERTQNNPAGRDTHFPGKNGGANKRYIYPPLPRTMEKKKSGTSVLSISLSHRPKGGSQFVNRDCVFLLLFPFLRICSRMKGTVSVYGKSRFLCHFFLFSPTLFLFSRRRTRISVAKNIHFEKLDSFLLRICTTAPRCPRNKH